MVGIVSQVAQEVPRVGRKTRRPQHRFQIQQRPWDITPFLIAPVLPGDTMKNALVQCRVVSDPIKNPLIGWWQEYYFFYIPHRAMSGTAAYQAMMLDASLDVTAGNRRVAVSSDLYTFANSPDYVKQCLDHVTAEWFRDEGEALVSNQVVSANYYTAQISLENWMDSLITKTAYDASTGVPDVDVEGTDANTTIQASEIDKAMRQWEFLRANRLTDQTYEDFLRTYGVSIPDQEKEHKGELLRYIREWSYPTNTVEPTTGTPSSALSYSIAERLDKDRFFKEPGFIFGVTVSRPKVYLSKQTGAAVGLLDNVFGWLPAVMGDDPYSSLKAMAAGAGPLPALSDANGYVLDVRDLYLYGDQFTNHSLADTDRNFVALPTNTLGSKRYPSSAEADALFTNAAGGKKYFRSDGVVTLTLLSRVVDSTSKV